MERYKVTLPNEKDIILKENFIVNQIFPLCIRNIDNEKYVLMFICNQDGTEEYIITQIMINASDDDREFLDNHPLNLNIIPKDPARLKLYIDMTKDIDNNSLYSCDFNMTEIDGKPYYKAVCANTIKNIGITAKDLIISRSIFIKLNLFFIRFMNHDPHAETIFFNAKLNNIKYSTVDRVKIDGSSTDLSSKLVCTHYTCGNGPETYKFNHLSRKIDGESLRYFMKPEVYSVFYSEHFTVCDYIYDANIDCIYVIYEERSDITDKYKCTYALKFTKEFYDKTAILDYSKIYNIKEV